MNTGWLAAVTGAAALATACVTINVYFPAAAAEQAADQIIDGVWGPGGRRPETEPQARPQRGTDTGRGTQLAGQVLNLLVPVAHAQAADLDISSPAIRNIEAAMAARHRQLLPYYDSGAIGLTANGLIEVRDQNLVPLAERNQLRRLVAEDNTDRNNLYREIAVANGNPQWESQIRETFARRWIERAQAGWYYRNARNEWQQK